MVTEHWGYLVVTWSWSLKWVLFWVYMKPDAWSRNVGTTEAPSHTMKGWGSNFGIFLCEFKYACLNNLNDLTGHLCAYVAYFYKLATFITVVD